MIQHVIRNSSEASATGLASMYKVSAIDILKSTFGASGASVIYPWLRDNGGVKQGSDKNVPTGFNWSWAEGMVVNVPADTSLSPLPSDPLALVGGQLKPGGPLVTVFGVSGGGLPQPEQPPVVVEKKAAGEPIDPKLTIDNPPEMKQAGFGIGGWLIVGAVGLIAFNMIMGKKQVFNMKSFKKGKKSKRR